MEEIVLKVVDFTEYPDVRYIEHDEFSGEQFYYNFVKPYFQKALHQHKKLVVDLDNTAGYASSFLDEAFGNLVYDFPFEDILSTLKIVSNQEPDWVFIILEDILYKWKEKKMNNTPRKEL